RVEMAHRLGARGWVVLETEPGWHPSQTAGDIEPQRIEGLRLSGEDGFGNLSPLQFSEIVYDIESITSSS
ncbi:MAG: Molybdate metabolism regulator, partial [Labilithrix sp.]|nr:Molybdate metabolism regulator [Labilithrix sp.]